MGNRGIVAGSPIGATDSSYSLNSRYNSGAHPAPYSVDSHRSLSEDKVVGASGWPLISILYTMPKRLKLCTNLPACPSVEHTHSPTSMMKDARGEPARVFVMVSPCALRCTSASISSANCQHKSANKHSQCLSACSLPCRHLQNSFF